MTALSDIATNLLRVREAIAGSIDPFRLRQLDEQIDRVLRLAALEACGRMEEAKDSEFRDGDEEPGGGN